MRLWRGEVERRKANHAAAPTETPDPDQEEQNLRNRIAELRKTLNTITSQKIVNQALVDRLHAHYIIRTTVTSPSISPTPLSQSPSPTPPAAEAPTTNFRNLLRQRDAYATEYLRLTSQQSALEHELHQLKMVNAKLEQQKSDSGKVTNPHPTLSQQTEYEQNVAALHMLRAKRITASNVFMHLLLDSDQDWARHPKRRELLEESEGVWIDDVWEEVTAHPAFGKRGGGGGEEGSVDVVMGDGYGGGGSGGGGAEVDLMDVGE
ncbi:hypothetical protein HDV00_002967 [Rhizophlyctis rosea]|nr:hypothetical protein HDV00_002967 [Rhizophlyctis rosea]